MTKTLRAPILLDESTARVVSENLDETVARCRRLVRVRPVGLDTPLTVSELLPPVARLVSGEENKGSTTAPYIPSAEDVAHYETALAAFQGGHWDEAFTELHHVAAEDRAKDFLVAFIASHNRTPPADWEGVIRLEHK